MNETLPKIEIYFDNKLSYFRVENPLKTMLNISTIYAHTTLQITKATELIMCIQIFFLRL